MELLDQYDEREALFGHIRHRWGDMVRAGDTTTWEQFAEFGHGGFPTRSRCHPYAAYVVKYLVKYLLGIEALAPGFATVRVQPNPPVGVDHCEGAIPTPPASCASPGAGNAPGLRRTWLPRAACAWRDSPPQLQHRLPLGLQQVPGDGHHGFAQLHGPWATADDIACVG